MPIVPLPFNNALAVLAANAANADAEAVWPAASWEALARSGVTAWVVPDAYGGAPGGAVELLDGYGRLAGACLTTCFLLSQRDAACRRLRDAGNEALARELLPPLARGETFATVGLSQLTTSRQHVRPALTAREEAGGVVLDGVMPWVTGAARADYFVTGAVLDDGRQVLAVVPRDAPGVTVGEPLPLAALQGSLTAEVRCAGVALDRRWLLAGPAERVLPPARGAGGLETSALALGLAAAAADYLRGEANRRPEWESAAESCLSSTAALRGRMSALARDGGTAAEAADLRAQANALVLRATQQALAAAKGTGFLRTHPTQRWARQALFFLVWSCPRPALEGTLAYLHPPCAE
jgi:alkylation response protein AidB-like acyl-CoA dehydrogenase